MTYLRTVHIEPPVTDEVLLVEQSTIGTEKTVLGQSTISKVGTNVERLTVCLWISVVALDLTVTDETGVRGEGKYGIVLAFEKIWLIHLFQLFTFVHK